MSSNELPPWGQMDERFLAEVEDDRIPTDWKPPDGVPPGLPGWQAWLAHVVGVIADRLWPVYVPGGSMWDTAAVEALFEADFGLMASLRSHLRAPIRARFETAVTHLEFFTQEDDDKVPFGDGYERYDSLFAAADRNKLRTAMAVGLNNKAGTVDLQMKMQFQRPRPWQVAVTQRRAGFSYRRGRTAFTPSLISGHCFQGVIAGCAAFEGLKGGMTSESIEVLKQFAVDIGDRRVFAGIHYPSDNLSSWYTAFRLVPTVFDPALVPQVSRFLWEAVTTKSTVFGAIRDHIVAHSDSPYALIVNAIEDAAAV
jgi:hypothetical protein